MSDNINDNGKRLRSIICPVDPVAARGWWKKKNGALEANLEVVKTDSEKKAAKAKDQEEALILADCILDATRELFPWNADLAKKTFDRVRPKLTYANVDELDPVLVAKIPLSTFPHPFTIDILEGDYQMAKKKQD